MHSSDMRSNSILRDVLLPRGREDEGREGLFLLQVDGIQTERWLVGMGVKEPPTLATELRLDTSERAGAVPKESTLPTLAAVSSNAARATPYRPRMPVVAAVVITK